MQSDARNVAHVGFQSTNILYTGSQCVNIPFVVHVAYNTISTKQPQQCNMKLDVADICCDILCFKFIVQTKPVGFISGKIPFYLDIHSDLSFFETMKPFRKKKKFAWLFLTYIKNSAFGLFMLCGTIQLLWKFCVVTLKLSWIFWLSVNFWPYTFKSFVFLYYYRNNLLSISLCVSILFNFSIFNYAY